MVLGFLFYSKNCKYCLNLMTLMSNDKMLHMFDAKCVDDMTDVQLTQIGLQGVPTLVIVNNKTGFKQIFEKNEAFNWLQSIRLNRRQNIIKQTENSSKLIQVTELKKNIKDGLFDYRQNELEGISDSYAYWKDDLAQDVDAPQPKTFLPYKADEQYTIMTIPEDQQMKNNKLKSDEQSQLVRKLEQMRESQNTQLKTMMEKEQINKVINGNSGIT